LTSQGKLQALIVGALPVLLAVILLRMEPAEMSLLFVTRAGMAALAVIVILEALGVYVIRRIVMIDV
jgi:tight adherence protein B